MNADELNRYKNDLWATYRALPMQTKKDTVAVRDTLGCLHYVQKRINVLREIKQELVMHGGFQ